MYVRLSKAVRTLSWILLFWILWNLVTLFSTMMSSSRSIMVHITMLSAVMAICLWKFTILNHVRPLFKSNIFYLNFMKLGHIVKYYDVFFKFDNSPYRTMLSVIMALCLWKLTNWNDVSSLSRILLIRILLNLVKLFSITMSSSSSIMVYIAQCFHLLWPFVYENSPF